MAGVNTDLFKLICSIADQHSAEIMATNLKEMFGCNKFEKSVASNALIKSPHLQDIDVEINGEERSYPLQQHNGGMAYFSPQSGWVPVKQDDLLVYKINFEWFLRAMMDAFEIPATTQPQIIVENKAWFLGSAYLKKKKTPIIFVRAVTKKDVTDGLFKYLQDKHIGDPALVLTSSSSVPAYFQLPGQNRIVFMSDAVDFESQKLAFKTAYLAEKMGSSVEQPGFNEGYRSAFINDVHYSFSPLQAEILEAMDKTGRHMHKTEIMAQTTSQQEEVKNAFRSKGKYHPAWGVIIKNDKKGNYWIES